MYNMVDIDMENKGTPVLEESVRARSVAFVTLGCKLNFSETSTIAQHFVEAGYERVPQNRPADIYVINTCSVTEHADKKCRNFIRKLHKQNPDAIIAVTGCYAQLKPQEILDIEGVDMVVGADRKGDLFQLVNENLKPLVTDDSARFSYSCAISEVNSIFPAFSQGERTRSFLKVQDGCDYHCSYCTIPLARGKSRNLSIATIVGEAKKIAAKGMVEVVLTGVNTGDFGKSTGEKFIDLLKALNEVEGIERYRISSIEPNLLNEETIRWIAGGTKFQNHFHIPLQSGCDRTLAAMHRKYDTARFYESVTLLRKFFPGCAITTDLITGFPGETEEDFTETLAFIEKCDFAAMHVFPYSIRPGTPAAKMVQVDMPIREERAHRAAQVAAKMHRSYLDGCVGKTFPVLFEQARGALYTGHAPNYMPVAVTGGEELHNAVRSVTITHTDGETLYGEIKEETE